MALRGHLTSKCHRTARYNHVDAGGKVNTSRAGRMHHLPRRRAAGTAEGIGGGGVIARVGFLSEANEVKIFNERSGGGQRC